MTRTERRASWHSCDHQRVMAPSNRDGVRRTTVSEQFTSRSGEPPTPEVAALSFLGTKFVRRYALRHRRAQCRESVSSACEVLSKPPKIRERCATHGGLPKKCGPLRAKGLGTR